MCVFIHYCYNKQNLKTKYVDYCCGRLIKTDFSSCMLNPSLYDREYGQGSMNRIIQDLLNKQKTTH